MSTATAIAWTDHTFNPWWGCSHVSPACDHCYAEALAKRWGHDVWGNGEHRLFGDTHWAEPLRWDAKAAAEGVDRRVFCASMADVFEDHPDLVEPRRRLWALVTRTWHLNWQVLTKRPQNIARMVPAEWDRRGDDWPSNCWIGTTVENQRYADLRIPKLAAVGGRTLRFLSCEPLLGPIDFGDRLLDRSYMSADGEPAKRIHWVIVGGESGPHHRPMHPDWLEDVVDQCRAAGVPVFTKQDSGARPGQQGRVPDRLWLKEFPA